MKIFTGQCWIPFPSSEYGGTWTVIAEDEAQCVELLKRDEENSWEKHDHRIPEVVLASHRFDLAGEHEAHIVDIFFT